MIDPAKRLLFLQPPMPQGLTVTKNDDDGSVTFRIGEHRHRPTPRGTSSASAPPPARSWTRTR